MTYLNNKCAFRRMPIVWGKTFNVNVKKKGYFSNYVNVFNKYMLYKKIHYSKFFSTSPNSDYVNYINQINGYIETFQKHSTSNSSDEENIICVLQKIKSDKKYEENEEIMEIISSIKLLIDKRVRPIIVNDGGDINFICFDIDNGIVYVQLEGACVSCSQSEVTLQYMIKNMLTYYISEIKEIKNVSQSGTIL
ncbi:NifU-like protein, putative [Hepatocystis sp. ex Piliocolobus tephrosceles]|nr:NifU-like protein, putative [Hepatocystis sp. ex Piliocolobus tephrosceles]